MSNVDRYVRFVSGCGLNRVVGVHVYDWMYELHISVHEAPSFAKEHLVIRVL